MDQATQLAQAGSGFRKQAEVRLSGMLRSSLDLRNLEQAYGSPVLKRLGWTRNGQGKTLAEIPAVPEKGSGVGRFVPSFADFVEREWRSEFYFRYKPSTRKWVDFVLGRQLLPAFGVMPLDEIESIDVNRWFDKYSMSSPGSANRALISFRQILNYAVACGLIPRNPAQEVRMNPRVRRTRFLSLEEIERLFQTLDSCVSKRPSFAAQADVIRLLLLTGCRRGEILNLQWREVGADTLELLDGKSGPRRVFLSADAVKIVQRQPRVSEFVFPSPRNPSRAISAGLRLWRNARKQAGLADVRLHDLRHTFASHAVMGGVPLPVVARLLGHSRASMTLRYSHVHDREVEEAAERIGAVVTGLLDADGCRPPARSNDGG